MSYTTMNFTLSAAVGGAAGNSNSTTITQTTNSSFQNIQQLIQNIFDGPSGGFWDDFNNFIPKGVVLKVTAS